MMLIGTNAFAQLSIGAGFVNSTTSLNVSIAGITAAKADAMLNGFFVGGSYNIPIGTSGLGVAPGIQFSYLTNNDVNLYFTKGDFSETYLSVPVDLNFGVELADGIKGLIYAGPTFSYGLTSKVKSGSLNYDIYDGQLDNLTDYKRFDVILGGGLGVEFYDMVRFSVGYDWGMLDRGPSAVEVRRNQLTVGISYIF